MKKSMLFIAVQAALGAAAAAMGLAPAAVALEVTKEEHAKLPKEVQALYVEKGGKFRLDTDVDDAAEVKEALRKEREGRKTEVKELKDMLKQWEGLDPAEIRSMLEKLGGDKEAQLIKAGKIDEVVALRTEKLVKAHEKAVADAAKQVEAANARAQKFSGQVLDNHVRAAASKAGVHQNAVEDALFRARTLFSLDDDGNAVQLDADKKPVMGKDGKTAFGPAEWVESMKESAPHWFPAGNAGGGASGGKPNSAGKRTMTRAQFDAIADPIEKSKTARDTNVQIVD